MGIQGLIPLLKDIQKPTSVSEFHGKTVGIDGYCWLHKGVYGCAKDVVEGKKTTVYINYVMKRINMLLNYNITPIMVFDGGYLPAKASKEKERRGLREENLKKAKALLRAGSNSQAYEYFQRCVEITPAMATEVIQACREKGVLCVVAPYEADAQLAYLEMQNITQFTITEDSDLLIYGCRRVLFKMNSDGDGIFIDLAELNKVKKVALESFTMEKFRHMCILSGCDYLPSVKGLGLYKAHKFLKKSTNVYKAIQLIKQSRKFNVPSDYAERFRKTDAVFKFQSVFDPRSKNIVRLNEVSETDDVTNEELLFAGPQIDREKAVKIALGNIDPISGETLADFDDFIKAKPVKDITRQVQTFVDEPKKQRNPNLQYSIDDDSSCKDNSDQIFEDQYIEKEDSENDSEDDEETFSSKLPHFLSKKHDDLSPPEKSLRNIHIYEQNSPKVSIGILYDDRNRKTPKASKFGHHSVFVKRKHHKLKNPFRVYEDEAEVEMSGQTSRYFGSQDAAKENEINSSNENSTASPDSSQDAGKQDQERTCRDKSQSPPDSKRVKYSLVEYLDTHSKNSLKTEANKLTDGGFPICSPESAPTTVKNTNRNKVIFSVGQDLRVTNARKDSDSFSGLPRLPTLPFDFNTQENSDKTPNRTVSQMPLSKFMYSKNSSNLKQNFKSRTSLFKISRNSEDCDNKNDEDSSNKDPTFNMQEIKLSQASENGQETFPLSQISVPDSEEMEMTPLDRCEKENEILNKHSVTHLQSRSLSEPTLPRRSSSKSLMGKCKTIGLSRKSKSSLDRVRGTASGFKQSKIAFDRFAYTKKKIDSKQDSPDDVVCIS